MTNGKEPRFNGDPYRHNPETEDTFTIHLPDHQLLPNVLFPLFTEAVDGPRTKIKPENIIIESPALGTLQLVNTNYNYGNTIFYYQPKDANDFVNPQLVIERHKDTGTFYIDSFRTPEQAQKLTEEGWQSKKKFVERWIQEKSDKEGVSPLEQILAEEIKTRKIIAAFRIEEDLNTGSTLKIHAKTMLPPWGKLLLKSLDDIRQIVFYSVSTGILRHKETTPGLSKGEFIMHYENPDKPNIKMFLHFLEPKELPLIPDILRSSFTIADIIKG